MNSLPEPAHTPIVLIVLFSLLFTILKCGDIGNNFNFKNEIKEGGEAQEVGQIETKKNQRGGIGVGIDLGTTFSSIAYASFNALRSVSL